jgi:hypothetical protein
LVVRGVQRGLGAATCEAAGHGVDHGPVDEGGGAFGVAGPSKVERPQASSAPPRCDGGEDLYRQPADPRIVESQGPPRPVTMATTPAHPGAVTKERRPRSFIASLQNLPCNAYLCTKASFSICIAKYCSAGARLSSPSSIRELGARLRSATSAASRPLPIRCPTEHQTAKQIDSGRHGSQCRIDEHPNRPADFGTRQHPATRAGSRGKAGRMVS